MKVFVEIYVLLLVSMFHRDTMDLELLYKMITFESFGVVLWSATKPARVGRLDFGHARRVATLRYVND
jgi:hypothetical protein